MTRTGKTLSILADYFKSKGKFLSIAEYKEATDTPIRFAVLKRNIGSWTRLEQMLKSKYPDLYKVDEVKTAVKPAVKTAAKTAAPAPTEVAANGTV